MYSPPSFNDLGKSAKDLFNKGYAHGFLKIDSTTKSGDNIEFKNSASHNLTSNKLAGNVEVKYKVPQYGVTVSEKWNTDNTLCSTIELKDQICKNSKVSLEAGYTPNSGKRNAQIKTEWSGDIFKINADATIVGGPIFTLSFVAVPYKEWYCGALGKFDLSTTQLRNHMVAFGRQAQDYTMHSYAKDGNEFGGSLYHRVSKNFECGAQFSWTNADHHNTQFGLASKYRVNKDLTLQAKINNQSHMSLSSIHDLSDTVKLTLSTSFGLTSPETVHKFGLGLEYKPLACCGQTSSSTPAPAH